MFWQFYVLTGVFLFSYFEYHPKSHHSEIIRSNKPITSKEFCVIKDNIERPLEPVTTSQIILGIGKLFAGFFSSNDGPSVIEFIANSNQKLNILNRKLDVVLQDLDEIKKMIDNVPSRVVEEVRKNELNAELRRYQALLTSLQGDKFKGNLISFAKNPTIKTEAETLASMIRTTKTQLQAIPDDPFRVPFVALAMNMEYYIRLNILREKPEVVAGTMSVDRDWLNEVMFTNANSVKTLLNNFQQERRGMLTNPSKNYVIRYIHVSSSGYVTSILHYSLTTNYSAILDTSEKDNDLEILRKIGILKEYDRPYSYVVASENAYHITDANPQVLYNKFDYDLGPNGRLPDFLNQKKPQWFAEDNGKLSANYMKILVLASSYYTGIKLLELCNVYINAAGLKKSTLNAK